MKPVLWFRIAAVLMLLFAAGHTFGFLTFRPASAEGQAVWSAMNDVRFSQGAAVFSYGNFYKGFGLSITASQLFFAWLAWWLGAMAARGSTEGRPIAWAMFLLQCVGFALSLRYFSVGPALFSALAALLFLTGALSLRPGVPHRTRPAPMG